MAQTPGWRMLNVLLPLLLSGCSVATPLPITPIQMMDGTWPPPAVNVASAGESEKAYTHKGDTMTITATGMAVTRASQEKWEFLPDLGKNAIHVLYRIQGEEPRPSLTVQLIDLPPGTDVGAALGVDKQNLEAAGVTIAQSTSSVGGLPGEAWDMGQTDPQSGITVRTLRIYVLIDQLTLALVQAQASEATFMELEADFTKMIQTVVLPQPAAEE